MKTPEFRKRLQDVRRIQKKLSKARVGLPVRVVFEYKVGVATCFPREKKWTIRVKNGVEFVHFNNERNDVTKHKARLYLKLAMVGLLRTDNDTDKTKV